MCFVLIVEKWDIISDRVKNQSLVLGLFVLESATAK